METLEGTRSNTLLDKVEADYKRARDELEGATLAYIGAKRIVPLMPKVLLDQSWWVFRRTEPGKWYLETMCMAEDSADELIRQLKLAGIHRITSEYISTNRWHYTGSFVAGGDVITIRVDGGSKPPACRIEETKEMREVTIYKAICEETGEEL